MYSKRVTNNLSVNLNNDYLDDNYSGISGFLFNMCHRNLEKNLRKKNYPNILEIGPGVKPHIDYINHSFKKYFVLETSDYAKEYLIDKYKGIEVTTYDGLNIPFVKEKFDRIILSHCLEHIENFENFLDQLYSILKKNGVISISLPTDPGLLWRIGRKIRLLLSSNKKISDLEYNYIMANEHINSVFNIKSVLNYKYKHQIVEIYLPFRIKLCDLNLFYNIQIYKK